MLKQSTPFYSDETRGYDDNIRNIVRSPEYKKAQKLLMSYKSDVIDVMNGLRANIENKDKIMEYYKELKAIDDSDVREAIDRVATVYDGHGIGSKARSKLQDDLQRIKNHAFAIADEIKGKKIQRNYTSGIIVVPSSENHS